MKSDPIRFFARQASLIGRRLSTYDGPFVQRSAGRTPGGPAVAASSGTVVFSSENPTSPPGTGSLRVAFFLHFFSQLGVILRLTFVPGCVNGF